MTQYDHESRIKQLEKELQQVKSLLKSAGLLDDFVKVSIAAKQLNMNPWVIRSRIRNDRSLELNKHYQRNGRVYLINVKEWRLLIAADDLENKK